MRKSLFAITAFKEKLIPLLKQGDWQEAFDYCEAHLTLTGNNLMRNTTNMQLEQGETHPDLGREITFTCASDKVEFYERVKNADGSDKVDSDNNPVYQKLTTITQTVANLPRAIYLRPLKDSNSKRDVELKLSYTSPQNGATHEDIVKLTLLHLDVDVDSNNDGTVAVDDETEDETELYAPIVINSGDKDDDGIADNIDFQVAGMDNVFKEMTIRLPQSIDLNNCKIKINYGAATLPDASGNLTSGGSQSLRVWKKQSNQLRTAADYVVPTLEDDPSTPDVDEETFYTPTDLMGEGKREVSLWVESVCEASNYNAQITVTIVPVTPKVISASTAIPADEATIPETYNLSDTVGFSTLGIILTFPNPIPATPTAGTTPASRGYDTILVSNIADESSDAKRPDYANFEARNDTSLLQLNMTVSIANLAKENFKIKFEYEGVTQLENLDRTEITGTVLKDIFMRDNKQYYDYTPFKKGLMRVWASSKPVENVGTWSSAKVITASSARDKGKYGISTGNYFAPANSVEDAYLLSDLLPDSNGTSFSMNFWVEGINPKDKTPIKATLLYNNNNSWQEVVASFVNVKVLEAKVILNTNNDKDYKLDDEDHKIKDQHDGFQGWFAAQFNSDTLADATSTHGFENLFPILLKNLPKLPDNNMKYELRINHAGTITQNPNSGNDRLAYLTSNSNTNSLKTALLTAGTSHSILQHDTTKDLGFIFGIYQTGTTANNQVSLLLYPDKDVSSYIVLDESFYTFRSVDQYFMAHSERTGSATAKIYPLDHGIPQINYTARTPTAMSGYGSRNINKDKYLIYIHGYSVNETDASLSFRTIFRRTYWLGYRDNFIGFTWEGNSSFMFDPNVKNALHASRSLYDFIISMQDNWNVQASNINLIAHSLGNLVAFDSLRQFSHSNKNALNNMISIEAAVWEETFWPQDDLEYRRLQYDYVQQPDGSIQTIITEQPNIESYSISRLISNTWCFWFNQEDHAVQDACNNIFSSYCDDDFALTAMLLNDNTGSNQSRYDHNSTEIRNAENLNKKLRMWRKDAVIAIVQENNQLTVPIGTKDMTMNGIQSQDAKNDKWQSKKHSDHLDLPLYDICDWYTAVIMPKI